MSCKETTSETIHSLFQIKGLILVLETADVSLLPPFINLINCCHITDLTIFLFLEENIKNIFPSLPPSILCKIDIEIFKCTKYLPFYFVFCFQFYS